MAQSLVLTLVGGAILRVSLLSTIYLNYVKPGFRPLLVIAGLVLFALGVLGLIQEWRRPYVGDAPTAPASEMDEPGHVGGHGLEPGHEGHASHGHGHGHGHGLGPKVAWLLCLPVVAIFLISPPALGADAAQRDNVPPPRPTPQNAYVPLIADRATAMPLGEFIGRAWGDETQSLKDRKVRLVGFVVPSKKKGQWYLTRMQLRCCAADAFPLRVAVLGLSAPRPDTWVEVTGTWVPTPYDRLPKGTVAPEMKATSLAKVAQPAEPYE
ncbi:TIGR03943 family protein [Sphaerisporangium sp. NPDC051017]|uniref:TIGR03943 family putative permease subunit n=1 Tax=Sphaerisporangium sp. NPDC051017 TaxID=3154636 RepID=UPI00341388DF